MRLKVVAACALCLWFGMLVISFLVMDPPSTSQGPRTTGCADISSNCLTLLDFCSSDDEDVRALLRLACPVTCESCGRPPVDFDCRDARQECQHIAAADQCDERPLTFWRDCPVSCRV